MAQILSFGFDWSHQPYPIAPKISQMAFAMPLGAFLHNLDLTPETFKGILPVDKGGTGGKTASEVRSNLGLGGAATANLTQSNVDTIAGRVLKVGDFGLGGNAARLIGTGVDDVIASGFGFSGLLFGVAGHAYIASMGTQSFVIGGYRKQLAYRTKDGAGAWSEVYEVRTTANTQVDGNGFLKAASPVADLYANHIELNSEAQQQDITFERVDTGNYLIRNSSGFAQEGWYIEVPKDARGNVLVSVEYKTLKNGDLSIKTYKKTFDFETASIVSDLDHPLDIPEGRFISLRLQGLPEPEFIDDPEITESDQTNTGVATAKDPTAQSSEEQPAK